MAQDGVRPRKRRRLHEGAIDVDDLDYDAVLRDASESQAAYEHA